jgi:hypothetical protein
VHRLGVLQIVKLQEEVDEGLLLRIGDGDGRRIERQRGVEFSGILDERILDERILDERYSQEESEVDNKWQRERG